MITSDVQSLEPGELIELFEIDSSSLGGLRSIGFTRTSTRASLPFNISSIVTGQWGHPGLKST